MQSQNVVEYKSIREEITTVRNCITTYVGFVVLGSATSFWGLAARASEKEPERLAMAFVSILLGITAMFVLFLLSYKFTSHNRYAGYSKLLAHEWFGSSPSAKASPGAPKKGPEGEGGGAGDRVEVVASGSGREAARDDYSCWEICLDRLRTTEASVSDLGEACSALEIQALVKLEKALQELDSELKLATTINDMSSSGMNHFGWLIGWFKGLGVMLAWGEKSGSWKFPVYIARIFAAMEFIFVLFAIYFLYTVSGYRYFDLGLRGVVVLIVILVFMWVIFLSKLAKQMLGGETVEAFCWKFVPIRTKFLRQLKVDYDLVGVIEAQDVKSSKSSATGAKKASLADSAGAGNRT